ncbi:GNAT family N-acetyltransferase [Variovorax sp. HJSM1_2]|uniref:GNAT family N-acetyltransferase n=1 Tax=Variovorax sp. HJSM1_2 TaxID=3366263 RepID=UPI003BEB1F41
MKRIHTEADLTVEGCQALSDLPDDARALMERAEHTSMQLGWSWYANLVDKVFADQTNDLWFYVLRRTSEVLAVLPLRVDREQGVLTLRALANYYTALYAPCLAASATAQDVAVLFRALKKSWPRLATVNLSPMDHGAAQFQLLQQAMSLGGLRHFDFFCFGNWYEPVRSDWKGYLMQRKANFRSTIKRHGAKLVEEGGRIELVDTASPQALEQAIEAYQKVYSASWKKDEPFAEFVPGLIRTCADKGWLRMGLAWMKDQPIAAQIWTVAHGKADIYKVAYDENFKAYSPGTLVSALLMEHVLTVDGVREVDFLVGDDAYKKVWMSARRERWGLVGYNPRVLAGLLGWQRELWWRKLKPLLARGKAALAAREKPAASTASTTSAAKD